MDERSRATGSSRGDNLSLLYQGILAVAGRIRSGEQVIGELQGLRQHLLALRTEVEKEALRRRYDRRLLEYASYAVIAFVDESIYSSNDPLSMQWAALQADIEGKPAGGEAFFEKVEELLRLPNSEQLADVLEVYLLCLLLGYEGQYGIVGPVIRDLEIRIELIRGRMERFSPEGTLEPDERRIPERDDAMLVRMRWITLGSLLVLLLLWIAFKLQLGWGSEDLVRNLKTT